MLKILIVGLNFHPELIGAGKYTGELAAYLASQGHQVRVITTPPYYPHWRVQPNYQAWQYRKETWRGVEIQRCPLWVPRHPTGLTRLIHLVTFAFSSLPALVAQFRWKPAVVLCMAPTLMNAPFVLAFARLIGTRTWLHIQDFELDAAAQSRNVTGPEIHPIHWHGSLERFLLTRFDRVSTISENMLTLVVQKGVPAETSFLLPNWVDTSEIFPMDDTNPLRSELGIPQAKKVILYHGNLGRKQGLEILIETAALLQDHPEILFVICGEGAARPRTGTKCDPNEECSVY